MHEHDHRPVEVPGEPSPIWCSSSAIIGRPTTGDKNWTWRTTSSRAAIPGTAQDPGARRGRRRAAGHDARSGDRRGQVLGPARPRRRRFSDRPEVELSCRASSRAQKYLVCNSDEGEPGTCKDRDILMLQPAHRDRGHGDRRLRDGDQGRLQLHPRRDLRGLRALRGGPRRGPRRRAARRQTCWVPPSAFELHAAHGFGAYICGEETALLESLEGKKGQPRFKPPFPASYGLYGKPTTINNTETFAAVPWIIRNGGRTVPRRSASRTTAAPRFSPWSATCRCPATTRVRWARRSPSCSNSQAACARGRKIKAVIPGGSSAPVLPASDHERPDHGLRLDRQGRVDARVGRGDRHGRNSRCMVKSAAAAVVLLHAKSRAGNARRAAKARAGCIRMVVRIVSSRAKGRMEDHRLAQFGLPTTSRAARFARWAMRRPCRCGR